MNSDMLHRLLRVTTLLSCKQYTEHACQIPVVVCLSGVLFTLCVTAAIVHEVALGNTTLLAQQC
jgi:hypothetical protein